MKSNNRTSLFLGLLAIALFWRIPFAQAQQPEPGESDEILSSPVVAPNTCDYYRWINSLPEETRRSAPFARQFFDAYRVMGPNGDWFDREARLQGYLRSQDDLRRSAAKELNAPRGGRPTPLASAWNLVGPVGATTQSGGCTVTIAIDPVNPNIVYAGAAGGGVWKSVDAGANWSSLTDNVIPDQNVCSIAVDPTNDNNIFVGSGSGNQGAGDFDWTGYGVFKSTDGGMSWKNIRSKGLTQTVSKVYVHPTKSNIVLAGAYNDARGIYRSTDGGDNFVKVWPATSNASGPIYDITSGETIGGLTTFYAVEGRGNAESGVYKSTDDGATWIKSSVGMSNATGFDRSYLHCPKLNPSRVFVFSSNRSTPYLYESSNSGATWTSRADLTSASGGVPKLCNVFQPQGDYDLAFGGTPTGDTLFVLGVEGAVNYETPTDKNGAWNEWSSYTNNEPGAPHVDHHSIAINPKDPTVVYNGNDGGVYKSTASGIPGSWAYSSNGMTTTRSYHLSLDKNDSRVTWYGAQDQGTWQIKAGVATSKRGGDGFQPLVSSQNSSLVFATLPYGWVYKSADAGSNWQLSDSGVSKQSPWNVALVMVPKNPAIIYKGEIGGILRKTTDGGNTWKTINTGLLSSVTAVGVSAASKDLVWAANDAAVRVSTDGGSTWASRSAGIVGGSIMTIVTSGSDQNFALAASYQPTKGQIYKTTDLGVTWVSVAGTGTNTLPHAGVMSVAIDSISPLSKWYAATDNGVYYTTDAGQSWWIAGSGLGLVVCTDIQLATNKTTMRIATYGRGIWEANINNITPISAVEGLTAIRNPNGTELRWHAAADSKATEYHIERSIATEAFEDLGIVHTSSDVTGAASYSFFDGTTTPGTYLFKVREVDADGSFSYSNLVELHYGADGLVLDQSFPNPFVRTGVALNQTTKIRFELPARDEATLRIFDASGNVVRTLIPMSHLDGGEHTAEWDGRSDAGTLVASGTYLYTLETTSGKRIVNKLSVID